MCNGSDYSAQCKRSQRLRIDDAAGFNQHDFAFGLSSPASEIRTRHESRWSSSTTEHFIPTAVAVPEICHSIKKPREAARGGKVGWWRKADRLAHLKRNFKKKLKRRQFLVRGRYSCDCWRKAGLFWRRLLLAEV